MHITTPTRVAPNLPITNTGRLRLELRKFPGGPSVPIPVKGTVMMPQGIYEVIAHGGVGLAVGIAMIDYDTRGFRVIPTNRSKEDAGFAVCVNVSDK